MDNTIIISKKIPTPQLTCHNLEKVAEKEILEFFHTFWQSENSKNLFLGSIFKQLFLRSLFSISLTNDFLKNISVQIHQFVRFWFLFRRCFLLLNSWQK